MLPSAAGKVLHKSVNSAKELITVTKNFKKAETMLAFEGAAVASASADEIANVMYKLRTAEEWVPHSSGVLSEIKNVTNITAKAEKKQILFYQELASQ